MTHGRKAFSLNASSMVRPIIMVLVFLGSVLWAEVLTPEQLLQLKTAGSVRISPDGQYLAYTVSVPRTADDKPGGAYTELYVHHLKSGRTIPFISGQVNVSSLQWKPDGKALTFTSRRGEDSRSQIWIIDIDGGEARKLSDSETGIIAYQWHPNGRQIAYIAEEPKTAREKALQKKGYEFILFEENLKHKNVYFIDVNPDYTAGPPEQLTRDITVWSMQFSPKGDQIALAATEKNLIDHSYMFQRVHILDLNSKQLRQLTNNPGKLDNYAFSPNGQFLAFNAALTRSDHASSQVFVIPVSGGEAQNLTRPNFIGHVQWVGWKNDQTVLYQAGEKTNTTLSEVTVQDRRHKTILSSVDQGGVIFSAPDYTNDFKHFAFSGNTPNHPSEAFYWQPGKKLQKISDLNPWLRETDLGKQEVVSYQSEDDHTIEGLLIYPVGYQKGQTYPLVVVVHGGPEAHYSNSWISGYATPGQVMAGKGYLVFYPNYRASTGYGVEFAAWGFGDAAGKEFDDIRDGIKHLIDIGLADAGRVGLGGGSYGGYASAWFATYYTEYVKAVCMFVGISNLISKRGTTDIPYEELYVHSGKLLDDMWQESLERSPIYYARQSKTATLIFGGTDDTRVHPAQSLELYRRMKMNDHPAVRLVQYPGEGHGNRKQPGRIDVLYRVMDWYDWYVKDAKPLDGPMPPLDISERYGLELPQ